MVSEKSLRIRPLMEGKATGPDNKPLLTPTWNNRQLSQWYKHSKIKDMRSDNTVTGKPRAIVFHDSYCMFILPYLAEHLGPTHWIWGPYDAELIKAERPDYVIEIRAERYLGLLLGL